MKNIIFIFLLFISVRVLADSLAPAYPYEMKSSNGLYKLSSIPFESYGVFGTSYIINETSLDTVYKLDEYLWQPTKIDDSGKYIVSIKSWPGKDPLDKITAIRFYRNGELYNSAKLSKLTNDSSYFFYSVSHISWYNNSEIDGQNFRILLKDGSLHTFDLKTGEIISSESLKNKENEISFSELPLRYNDSIQYPNPFEFPDLRSSIDFYKAFNSTMPFRIFSYSYPEKIRVNTEAFYCMLMIDSKGSGQLVDFEFDDRKMRESIFGTDKPYQRKIAEFISKQKFDTSTLPEGIPKWVFSTWIYIEQKE